MSKFFYFHFDFHKKLFFLRLFQKKIVFTNGCFDILHPGHLDYLYQAKNLGDILIVGLNHDDSISSLKGKSRPINNFDVRAANLSSLFFVDYIIGFAELTPLNLIHYIQPDVLVKADDYRVEDIVGYDFVSSYGGLVTTIPMKQGFSTSSIINKIQSINS